MKRIAISLVLALVACGSSAAPDDASGSGRANGFIPNGGPFLPPSGITSAGGAGLSGGTTSDLAYWTSASTIGNYAGSSPAACGAGSADTNVALSAAGALTHTCSANVSSVVAGAGISANTASGAATVTANLSGASCAAGTSVTAISSAGAGTCSTNVSSVVAGTDTTVSTASGAATVNVDETLAQHRVSGTCTAPNSIRAVAQDGTVTCTTGVSQLTNGAGANVIPKSDGTNLVASTISDSGTPSFSAGLTSTAGTNTVGNLTETFETLSSGTGTVNNLAISATKTGALYTCGAPTTITGFAAPSGSVTQVYTVVAVSGQCKFSNQNASSTAANRFINGNAGSDWTITAGDVATFVYDTTATRWRPILVTSGPSLQVVNSITNRFVVSSDGHIHTITTSPAASSCGSGPTVTGGDSGFIVTTGSGATACTLTFGTAFTTNAPACILTADGGATLPSVSRSTSAITLGTGTTGSTTYSVHCFAVN